MSNNLRLVLKTKQSRSDVPITVHASVEKVICRFKTLFWLFKCYLLPSIMNHV